MYARSVRAMVYSVASVIHGVETSGYVNAVIKEMINFKWMMIQMGVLGTSVSCMAASSVISC